ncbi:hypothetical protein [Streptomyces violaceusniger]|uniref:hypothetical protein n=1 Tax=Streptomyces violaceusniger TaxID=68280 RepID=UPI00255C5FE6|nr:hypothetical protein [Streptomyces violaceusniger]
MRGDDGRGLHFGPQGSVRVSRIALPEVVGQGALAGMDSVFGLHHFAHAHNAEVAGDTLGGMDARGMGAAGGRSATDAAKDETRHR